MIITRQKYLEMLVAGQGNGLVKIVTGGRRCGKSFLLFQIFHQFIEGGFCITGFRGQPSSACNLAYFFYWKGCQNRFPQTGTVHIISISNHTCGSGRGTAFLFVEVYNHPVVFHCKKGGLPGLKAQLFQDRPCLGMYIGPAQVGAPYFKTVYI